MKLPNPFYSLIIVLCSLLFFIFGSFLAGGIIATSIALTDQPATWVSAIATVMAAIGTVSTLAFLSYQHMLDKNNKEKESIIALSQDSLNAYIVAVNSLINYLEDNNIDKKRKFAFLKPTYSNLSELEKRITIDNHRVLMSAKYEELYVHLDMFYYDLNVRDFYEVDKNVNSNNISLSEYSREWSSSIHILIVTWLKYVVPNYATKDTNNIAYGMGQLMVPMDEVMYLLAFFMSSSDNMMSVSEIRRNIASLAYFEPENLHTRPEIDDIWYATITSTYPLLFAHLFLRISQFRAVKTSENPLIFYPSFSIYGPQDTWLCMDHINGAITICLGTPYPLNTSRFVRRKIEETKIPNVNEYCFHY